MAQCRGVTKKGDQCKRDAQEGSEFCAIHVDQEIRPRQQKTRTEWDSDAIFKAAIGIGLLAIVLFLGRRR